MCNIQNLLSCCTHVLKRTMPCYISCDLDGRKLWTGFWEHPDWICTIWVERGMCWMNLDNICAERGRNPGNICLHLLFSRWVIHIIYNRENKVSRMLAWPTTMSCYLHISMSWCRFEWKNVMRSKNYKNYGFCHLMSSHKVGMILANSHHSHTDSIGGISHLTESKCCVNYPYSIDWWVEMATPLSAEIKSVDYVRQSCIALTCFHGH